MERQQADLFPFYRNLSLCSYRWNGSKPAFPLLLSFLVVQQQLKQVGFFLLAEVNLCSPCSAAPFMRFHLFGKNSGVAARREQSSLPRVPCLQIIYLR